MARNQEEVKRKVTAGNYLLSIMAEEELKKAWSGKMVLFVELCGSVGNYSHEREDSAEGGPLESRSLMKDSYTPDVIQKAIRDPKNWYGRRADELGKWYRKNALDLNVQKALEAKYGKKEGKKKEDKKKEDED